MWHYYEFQTSGNNIVSVALPMGSSPHHQHTPHSFSLTSSPSTLLASSNGSSPAVVIQPNEYSFQTSPASVTVDLPSIQPHHTSGGHVASEENGVLLCNLDDLSRYIPENFYSDFTLAEQHHPQQIPDYLQTVVAGKAITTTVSASHPATSISSTSGIPLYSQSSGGHQSSITIQLPTQPQPIQGVKTVTYVNPFKAANNNNTAEVAAGSSPVVSQVSPGKVTQYAYTPSGERIAIHGLPPEATKPGSTLQVQVKGGGMQTLQLSAVEPGSSTSKLTVVQELPEVGKVVIQDNSKPVGTDSISEILEGMKQDPDGNVNVNAEGMAEYTTAIPVAVSSLASDPKKTTIKRVAAPASTVFLPAQQSGNNSSAGTGNKSRIIFAGNTLPQGAIPIQINGLNAIPITAVKSLPFTLNTLTNSSPNNTTVISPAIGPSANTNNPATSPIKKVSKPVQKSSPNKSNSGGNGSFPKIQSTNLANINKAIGT